MPQFSHQDRCIMDTEHRVWAAQELLRGIENAGSWEQCIKTLICQLGGIGEDIRRYNDQFEQDED